ncbi:MAG: chemotaxis protein CheW [Chloroflexota bacterium]|nr:chemotaxis protein CheW [Chloroflexota bacterium]
MNQNSQFGLPSSYRLQTTNTQETYEQVVIFQLRDEVYAVPVARVQEIIRLQPITVIPRAPDYVLGMTNLRGQVIPVIDLVKRLGLGQVQENKLARIIIAELPGQMVGMMVDNVISVAQLPQSEIEPPSPVVLSVDSQFIMGLTQYHEYLIILLNLDKVLSRPVDTTLS